MKAPTPFCREDVSQCLLFDRIIVVVVVYGSSEGMNEIEGWNGKDRIGHKVPAPWPSSVVPLRAFPFPPFAFFLSSLLFGEGGRYCNEEECIFGTVVERERVRWRTTSEGGLRIYF